MGVDGFKTDFGEQVPADAVFYDGSPGSEMQIASPQLYNQVTYEAMFPPYPWHSIGRSAWDGSQSYSAIWAGDQSADFWPRHGFAERHHGWPETAGLSGFPFWASDIGGYFGQRAEEVFARWIAFGAFFPDMQIAWSGLPRTLEVSPKKSWRFTGTTHGFTAISFLYISLSRHTSRANRDADPCAPCRWFSDDPAIWQPNAEISYCFGGASCWWHQSTSVTVPNGMCICHQGCGVDFWSGETYPGGREIVVTAELNQIPVFARAGALIPLLDPSADTLLPVVDEPEIKVAGDHLRLQIYPGADGRFELHDGTQFRWLEATHTLQVAAQPIERFISIRMMTADLQLDQVQDDHGQPIPPKTPTWMETLIIFVSRPFQNTPTR